MVKSLRAVAEIEAGGEWLSEPNTGIDARRLHALRKRRILKRGTDWKRIKVRVAFTDGREEEMPRFFYRSTSIARYKADRAAYLARGGKRPDRITRPDGTVLLSRQAAAALLEINTTTLESWTEKGHVAKDENRKARKRLSRTLEPIGHGRKDWYWYLTEIEKLKAALASFTEEPTDDDVYSRRKAAELIGVSAYRLRRKKVVNALGLVRVMRPVRIVATFKSGERYERIVSVPCFTKESVDAAATAHAVPPITPAKMGTGEASQILQLTRTTVLRLVAEGILRGDKPGPIPTARGSRKGGLVTRESVNWLKPKLAGATTGRQKQIILERIRREHAVKTPHAAAADPPLPAEPLVGGVRSVREVEAYQGGSAGRPIPYVVELTEASIRQQAEMHAEASEMLLHRLMTSFYGGSLPGQSPPAPASKGASGAAGQTDARPKQYLFSWRDILGALDLKYDAERREQVSRVNETYGGPIVKGGKGEQPFADRDELRAWWDRLGEMVRDRQRREGDAEGTLSDQHPYGRDGTVYPEIGGHEKKRRADRDPTSGT